jgi:FkbM family methyltransferase
MVPRYQPGTVIAGDWRLDYLDAASVLSNFDVVVVKRWNDFECDKDDPVILDCGANIGISAIHYKRIFPKARVTSFEPDPNACTLLRRNLIANEIHDVEVVQKALWTSNGEGDFFSEGADAGRLVAKSHELNHLTTLTPTGQQCTVETVRLVDYLANEEIDFIKLDIEGAETEVILDSADLLERVRAMVIEFHLMTSTPRDLATLLEALANAEFHVSVGSYGPWVDLLHKTSGIQNTNVEFDQNLLICAWRP